MTTMHRVLLAVALAACDAGPRPLEAEVVADAAVDGAATDAATPDATPIDAAIDAAPIDAAPIDAAPIDAAPIDAAPPNPLAQLLGTGEDPDLAIDADGNAIAIWTHGVSIETRRYVPTSGWGAVTRLDLTGGERREDPQVVIAPSGEAIAAWSQREDGIWTARYVPGAGWEPPVRIDATATSGLLDSWLQLAIDPTGNAMALWTHFGSTRTLLSRRHVPGAGWGPIVQLNAPGTTPYDARLAFDAAGHGLAVWRQSPGLWSSRFVPGTGWSAPEAVPGVVASNQHTWSLAADPAGDVFVAAFASTGPLLGRLTGSRFVPGVGWEPATVLDAGSVSSPALAVDAAGDAFVTWWSSGVRRAQRYVPGAGWGAPIALGWSGSLRSAAQPVAGFTTVWGRTDEDEHSELFGRRFSWGNWGTETRLDAAITGGIHDTRVEVLPTGDALAIWSHCPGEPHSGATYYIWAATF